MSAVPVTIQAIVYPRDKSGDPYPATIVGFATITGLGPSTGPIAPPPDVPVEPPLVIWGPPGPWPTPPIVIPPDPPPVDPPASVEPPHEGWNWSAANSGWYYLYIPGPGKPGPKK